MVDYHTYYYRVSLPLPLRLQKSTNLYPKLLRAKECLKSLNILVEALPQHKHRIGSTLKMLGIHAALTASSFHKSLPDTVANFLANLFERSPAKT